MDILCYWRNGLGKNEFVINFWRGCVDNRVDERTKNPRLSNHVSMRGETEVTIYDFGLITRPSVSVISKNIFRIRFSVKVGLDGFPRLPEIVGVPYINMALSKGVLNFCDFSLVSVICMNKKNANHPSDCTLHWYLSTWKISAPSRLQPSDISYVKLRIFVFYWSQERRLP